MRIVEHVRRVELGRLSICLLLSALFTSCIKYRPLELDPVKTAAEVRSRALPAMLDPDSLAEAAVANSGNVAIARARLAEAEAAIITAKQRINPAVSGEGGYNRTPESVSTYSASFGYTIETGGKRAYRTLAAQKNAEAARIAVAEAEWQARSATRAALGKYYFAQRLHASAQSELDARREAVAILEARLRLGEASRPELNVVRADLATAEITLKAAQGDVIQALSEVAAATGLPVGMLESRPLALDAFDAPPPADLLPLSQVEKAGLLHRADIQRTLAEYAAADAHLRLEIANQYPNVTLTPAYSFQEGFPSYTLGVALESLPVLHRQQGPIAEAEAARLEVRARFLSLQAQAIADTESALRAYRAAVSAWTAVRDSVVAVQRQREQQVTRSFQAGESDRLDVTQSRIATIAADRALLDASQNAQTALIALEDAIQSKLTQEAGR